MVPWYLFDWGGSKAARCSQYIAAKVLNQIIMKISECRAITSIISPANQDIFNKLSIYFILRSDLPPVETCRICRSSTVCQGKGMSASGRSRRLHRLDFMWQKDIGVRALTLMMLLTRSTQPCNNFSSVSIIRFYICRWAEALLVPTLCLSLCFLSLSASTLTI